MWWAWPAATSAGTTWAAGTRSTNCFHETPAGNVVRSDAILEAATGNYVHAPGKLVALVGVEDLVVVDTPDALLIVDRDLSQHVGKIVKRLELAQRDDLL